MNHKKLPGSFASLRMTGIGFFTGSALRMTTDRILREFLCLAARHGEDVQVVPDQCGPEWQACLTMNAVMK